jgi:hypothetical protein
LGGTIRKDVVTGGFWLAVLLQVGAAALAFPVRQATDENKLHRARTTTEERRI